MKTNLSELKVFNLSNYYLSADTAHNLHGFDSELILDELEKATDGRQFTNYSGAKETYILITLECETYGVGIKLNGDTVEVRTLLTPSMVKLNETRKARAINLQRFLVA